MKTIVLDDDPTGTQSARDVDVVWDADADRLRVALSDADAVFVQTNSRALDAPAARALLTSIRSAARQAVPDEPVRFVLRGDSTLRGHVFDEIGVFAERTTKIVFVPAFPAGGRITRDGVHLVTVDGRLIPASETEYAQDPVFPFRSSALVDYVSEKSDRRAVHVTLDAVRSGRMTAAVLDAPAGSVAVVDAETDDDIVSIADAVRQAESAGADVLVRGAAPIAAELAGVRSTALLDATALGDIGMLGDGVTTESAEVLPSGPLLVVCGSHTEGARRQLDLLDPHHERIVVDTRAALDDPMGEARRVAGIARARLDSGRAIVTSERDRRSEHDTLEHGARVAEAMVGVVANLRDVVGSLIVKGGITSAEVARRGLGAAGARVRGQILPGIALWSVEDRDRRIHPYLVVPGNVGADDVLLELAKRVDLAAAREAN